MNLNNSEFLVCLSVCLLAYFLTEIMSIWRLIQFWMRDHSEFFGDILGIFLECFKIILNSQGWTRSKCLSLPPRSKLKLNFALIKKLIFCMKRRLWKFFFNDKIQGSPHTLRLSFRGSKALLVIKYFFPDFHWLRYQLDQHFALINLCIFQILAPKTFDIYFHCLKSAP